MKKRKYNESFKKYKFYVLALAVISLGACNTIEGAGHDLEHAGEAVQDAAK